MFQITWVAQLIDIGEHYFIVLIDINVESIITNGGKEQVDNDFRISEIQKPLN